MFGVILAFARVTELTMAATAATDRRLVHVPVVYEICGKVLGA